MTTQEHLQRIRDRCEELIAAYLFEHKESDARVAGWRATIAAAEAVLSFFDSIQNSDPSSQQERECRIAMVVLREAIIAAWPEELL